MVILQEGKMELLWIVQENVNLSMGKVTLLKFFLAAAQPIADSLVGLTFEAEPSVGFYWGRTATLRSGLPRGRNPLG